MATNSLLTGTVGHSRVAIKSAVGRLVEITTRFAITLYCSLVVGVVTVCDSYLFTSAPANLLCDGKRLGRRFVVVWAVGIGR